MESFGFQILAILILALHFLWIVWVIFGCLLTRNHRSLAPLHIASLICSIMVQVGPWSCPLTRTEQWAQEKAGLTPYQGDFVGHYLEASVCPGNPRRLVIVGAVLVCVFNLGVHAARTRRS